MAKKLLEQMRDALRLKHYSYRTEEAYLDWVKRYILFLYREVLHQEVEPVLPSNAKRPERLPTVLTHDEARRLIANLGGTYKLMAQILYGSGLRLMECVRLRIKDIVFEYQTITVRDGKGEKDRVTPLPQSIIPDLKRQIERVRLLHEEDLLAGAGTVYLHSQPRRPRRAEPDRLIGIADLQSAI